MITVIVALMTLPCHCWGKVRLSRQEWATVPLKPHTHTHHKLSLSPLVTGPHMRRASDVGVMAQMGQE